MWLRVLVDYQPVNDKRVVATSAMDGKSNDLKLQGRTNISFAWPPLSSKRPILCYGRKYENNEN